MDIRETSEPAFEAPVAVAARPRTLVLSIDSTIDARMFGPKRQLLGPPVQLTIPMQPRAIAKLWPVLEALGEFDRVSVIVAPEAESRGPEWAPRALAEELQHQTGRHVRHVTTAELRASVIRGEGVEIVLALGAPLTTWMFVDGTAIPQFALARHPFRKDRTYAEYLAPAALARKGPRAAARRLSRVAATLTDVWNPTAVHVWIPDDLALDLGAITDARVHRCGADYAAAAALWGPLSGA